MKKEIEVIKIDEGFTTIKISKIGAVMFQASDSIILTIDDIKKLVDVLTPLTI